MGRKNVGTVCALSLMVVLAGCGSRDSGKSGKFLERGKEYAAKNDYARAILQFRNEAKLLPNSAEPYYQLGLAYLGLHDASAAYVHFKKAVELDPNHTGAQIKLAEMLARNENKDLRKQAQDRANAVLQRSPGNPEALTVLGVTEITSGNKKAGEEQLRAALESAPTHLKSAVFLAALKVKENDFAGAEQVLKSVVEKDPNSVDAALALGKFYSSARRPNEAISEYQRAVKLQPDKGIALFLLAQMQIATGHVAEGEQLLRRLSALPDKQYRTVHAMYLLESNHLDAGVAELEQIYRKDPSDRSTRGLLTRIYMVINRAGDAEKLLTSALKANPKDTEALLGRSDMLLSRGKYTEAQNDISEVLRLTPDSADAHWIMAKLHKRRGSPLQSRQELIEALRLNPTLVGARVYLAETDLDRGAPAAALEWLEKAPAPQQASGPIVTERIKALLAMRRYADARSDINEALKADRSRDLLMLDAQLRFAQKDFAGARAVTEEVLKRMPEDILALDIVAACYGNEKHPDLALKRIRDQVTLHPKSARLQLRLALQLIADHKNEEARQALVEAVRIDPAFIPAALELAKMDMREGNNEEARRRLTAVLSSRPSETYARLLLAQIEVKASNIPAAINHYRRVLDDDSNNLTALNNLASLLADEVNGVDEALKYAQQLKELAPDDSLVDDTLGWAFYRKGLYINAVQHLKSAAIKQQNPAIKYHLAMAYFKAGDTTNAQKTLAVALKESPHVAEAQAAQKLINH